MSEEKRVNRKVAEEQRKIRLNNAFTLYQKFSRPDSLEETRKLKVRNLKARKLKKLSDEDLDLVKDEASRYGKARYRTLSDIVHERGLDDPGAAATWNSLLGPQLRHKR